MKWYCSRTFVCLFSVCSVTCLGDWPDLGYMFLWAVLPLLQTLPCTCIMDIDLVTPESDLLQHLIIASDNLGDQHIYMCEMIFLFFS